jgi:hypothetical protein
MILHLDSVKSAQSILGGFGFSKKEITDLYSDVSDGEFITFLVDPVDGRRSPIHRDIGGVELLLKEFAQETKYRTPFPQVSATSGKTKKTGKTTKSNKKKKTTAKKESTDEL